ncbi:Ig-like domain repeat protein [Leifsonia sp. F6_8S_P_1B]|uniref:Ig-like domain repeat protein n=1 Tax=Leifsonia williamsii TaxID=3035919 RepID=A0ABT8KFR8_9MICO|nr:Ig-like domain repeat protein [Leifsonia williamsii]MDN4616295.1 Ig-like domain repeat protein [Leifsonia williamsii]
MRPKSDARPVVPALTSLRAHTSHARRALRRTAVTAAAVLGLAGLALTGATASYGAAQPQTTFVNEGFTGTSAGAGYTLPSAAPGSFVTNSACLTARTSTTATASDTIPGCGGTADADGSGALRLTSATLNMTGGVGAKQSVPITKGIDAIFDSYQYNGVSDGTGTADGIVFYLAATDPYNPTVPTQIGQLGGSLGYSGTKTASGLAHAYLGLGLDRYGNFNHPNFGGNGCAADASRPRYPNNVTVRGPGDGTTGYCVVTSTAGTALTGSLSKSGVTDRSQAKVPVEIVINPTAAPLQAQRATDVTVNAGQFAVIFTPIGGTRQTLTGTLPKLNPAGNQASIPASWIDPATQYPYKLTYGWVAGTGGASDVHEVNYLEAKTAAGPVPVLSATAGADAEVAHGGNGLYTVTPTVTSGGGTESQLIRATTTFPAGFTPSAATPSAGWSCTVAGQVATCDYAVDPAAPIQPGTAVAELAVPYTVSGTTRTATISSVVASTDAEAVTASSAVTVLKQPVSVTVGDVTAELGATATFTATVASTSKYAPTTPTGSVTFTDDTTGAELCTAPVNAAGVASCTAPAAGQVGAHTVLTSYTGDADHEAVTGADRAASALDITKVSTTVAIAIVPAEAAYGTAATLSATGLPADATGTLTFTSGGDTLCATQLPVTSCATSTSLPAGAYPITVAYSGDDTYKPSDSMEATLTIRKAATPISGTPGDPGNGGNPGNPGNGGNPGTGDPDVVTVTHGEPTGVPVPTLPKDATGTISLVTDDGKVLCTATLPATTCTVPGDLPGGTYTVKAVYSGDDNYEPATGDPFTLVVAAQSTAIVAHQTTAKNGTVTLRVSGLPAGATGTVAFRLADGTELCTVTLPAESCDTTGLAAGDHIVTAFYSGDASFAASTSQVTVTVEAAPAPPAPPVVTPTATPTATPDAPAPSPSATPVAAASGLAHTGSDVAVGGIALAALALLAGGLVLLQLRRRRA